MKVPNINARDFASILNINPYQTIFQLLESKVEKKYPFFGNKFTEHGVKYEKLALEVYQKTTGNNVNTEQTNCKHPQYNFITGRTDGIAYIKDTKVQEPETNDDYETANAGKKRKRRNFDNETSNKRKKSMCIIEVKCPLKSDRAETLTLDNIPKYYWSQCQVYMEMLDCDTTHYVEYYIEPNGKKNSGKIYILEIKRDKQWWDSSLPKIMAFYEEMKKYCEKGSLNSHPIRIAEQKWDKGLSPAISKHTL
jgi:hypothetical protein